MASEAYTKNLFLAKATWKRYELAMQAAKTGDINVQDANTVLKMWFATIEATLKSMPVPQDIKK